jgi:hypothetical protein
VSLGRSPIAAFEGYAAGSQRIGAALADGKVVSGLILLVAVLLQVRFGAFGDVSWLITVCEGWLDGKTPYVDFLETNPPPAILLYMPPVLLARALHLRPELATAAYGLAIACGSVALATRILALAKLLAPESRLFAPIALLVLTLTPGRIFDERDFFALLFGLPFVAVASARAARAPVDWRLAALAGLGAGLMTAIKPPYGAVPALLMIYVVFSGGRLRSLWAIEIVTGAAVVGVLAAVSWFGFPAYFTMVLPMVAAAYLPVRESAATLVANAGLVCAATLAGLVFFASPRRIPNPVARAFLVAAAGAVVAYFVQGKGWLYHVYPAIALAAIAFGASLETRARDGEALALAAAVAIATLGGAVAFDLPPLPTSLIGALVARLVLMRWSPDQGRERLSLLAGGAMIGAASGLFALSFPGPTPDFVRTLVSYAPHPRIATIGEGLGLGFPLVRNVDGVWAMRVQGMLMTAGARRLMDLNPRDEALKARVLPIIDRERDEVAEDLMANRPDILLVSRHGPRFHAWAMSDPKLAEARSPYRFVMGNANPDWPVDLYVREDLIGLRAAP